MPEDNPLREQLLARQTHDSPQYLTYRKEMEMSIANLEAGLKFERRFVAVLWIGLVLMSMGFLFLGGLTPNRPLGTWFGILACFWMQFGAVEMLKHFINRARVDVLKELKTVQMDVNALQARLDRVDSPRD